MWILKFLGLRPDGEMPAEADAEATDAVRRIIRSLEELPPERARFIAAFAFILTRVANVDLDITAEETAAMEAIVQRHLGLPEAQAALVVQIAKSQSRLRGGTENFRVTREFARTATRQEKLALLACLFAVSAADEEVTAREDSTVHQVARELGLDHRDFISARAQVRDQLGVMRGLPRRET